MQNTSDKAKAIEFAMKSYDAVYDESEFPLHLRWEHILLHHPSMARRSLHDNLTDIYKRAFETMTGDRLVTALDLSCLQAHYWNWLRTNELIPHHAYFTEISHFNLWQRRLSERVVATKGPERKGSRIHNHKNDPIPSHRYVH